MTVVAHVYDNELGRIRVVEKGDIVEGFFPFFSLAGNFFFSLFLPLSGVWRTIRLHSTSDPDRCTLI